MKSLKLTCNVTGKTTLYADIFLQKKIEEYGDVGKLKQFYVCREVKSLLKKGYRVTEIRKILNVPEDIDPPDETTIAEIEKNYSKNEYNTNTTNGILSGIADLTNDKSDPDVDYFFTNIFARKVNL